MWIILLAMTLLVAGGSDAAIFDVDSTADAVDATLDGTCATTLGECTLRAAIQEANAAVSADTINIPAGTYTLTIAGTDENAAASGDLDILAGSGTLDINGVGTAVTIIDGGDLDRVFQVSAIDEYACCINATISDLTIRNGTTTYLGGGIYNSGALTLTRVILRDNEGLLGGGIANVIGGTVTMSDSVVTGNTAESGGGIYQFADSPPMDLSNVTISGNNARASGGGVLSAMFQIAMNNVTIAGNTADSDANGSGNGGGIHTTFVVFAGGSIHIKNSIVAGNSDAGGEAPDCSSDPTSGITSAGYNLIGDTTGCTIGGSATGNLLDVAPLLGPLADNGGNTLTHALLSGSPARDAGNPAVPGSGGGACAAADQRGIARPVGSYCDMGAFEDTTPGGAGPELDHYKCYQGRDLRSPAFATLEAGTTDQFTDESVRVLRLKYVCTPVDTNGAGINDPAAHLICYQISGDSLAPRPVVEISSQFQTSRFEIKKPKLLCVPGTKTVLP